MSQSSAIEWTDATWNPVTGCTRVSAGCAHCYIERQTPMRIAGRKFERVGNEETTGLQFHPERLEQPLHWRKPRRVFVNSMSDLFHEEIPYWFIHNVFKTMHDAPQHTFQILTKRPERMLDFYRYERAWFIGGTKRFDEDWPLPNVWLGVSIENARYTWRADVLREIPAAVRFISAEPLLGSLMEDDPVGPQARSRTRKPLDLTGIDWLIVGGESGPEHRPMNLDHARELRDACLATQHPPVCCGQPDYPAVCCGRFLPTGECCSEPVPGDPECCQQPEQSPDPGTAFFFKQVGGRTPKSGGRLLDGREWNEMPSVAVPA